MQKWRQLTGMGFVVLSLTAAACGKREAAAPAPAPRMPASAELDESGATQPMSVLDTVYQLVEQGDAEAALTLLNESLAQNPDMPEKPDLVREQLIILLMLDRVAAAQERYLEILATDPQSALMTFGIIELHLQQTGTADDQVIWVRRVLQAGPPPELWAHLGRLELEALQADDRMDDFLERLGDYNLQLGHETLAAILQGLADQLIRTDCLDAAQLLAQWLEDAGQAAASAPYRRLGGLLRVDLAMARGIWESLPEAAVAALPYLDDREAVGRLDAWFRATQRADQHAVADRLAEQVLAQRAAFPQAAWRAARWWIFLPRGRGDLDLSLTRFDGLVRDGVVPPKQLPPLLVVISSFIYDDATTERIQRFLAISDGLPWSEMEAGERSRQIGMLLDLSFTAGDYERSEALLQEGLPEHDARWHEVMLNKIRAHMAQDAGRTDEAVERFRRFMADVAEGPEEDLIDPVDGRRISPPMIQALNAQRIGDILLAAERTDAAAAAFAEAVQFYDQAAAAVPANSREAAWILEQRAKLPLPVAP